MDTHAAGPDGPALPVACTLNADDGAQRMRRWDALAGAAAPVATRNGPVLEVRYQRGAGVHDELAALAAAEQQCCGFVEWVVSDGETGPLLRVTAPAGRPDDIAAIAALFGAP